MEKHEHSPGCSGYRRELEGQLAKTQAALRTIRMIAEGRRHYSDDAGGEGCFDALGEVKAIASAVLAAPPPADTYLSLCRVCLRSTSPTCDVYCREHEREVDARTRARAAKVRVLSDDYVEGKLSRREFDAEKGPG